MIKQRRSQYRVHWLMPCAFKQRLGENDDVHSGWGFLRNINTMGAELATRFPINPKESIFLQFHLGPQFLFRDLSATIKRSSKEGIYNVVGLKFNGNIEKHKINRAMASFLTWQNSQNK